MKTLLTTLCLVLGFTVATYAQTENGPKMTFESTTVDYGTIEKNSDRIRSLKFTNTGDEPLIIKNAKSSCGCTVPSVPKEPVMPGESEELKISYATNRVGNINKTVKITTNEGAEPHIIRVKGKVLPETKEESTPKKKSTLGTAGDGR